MNIDTSIGIGVDTDISINIKINTINATCIIDNNE